MKKIMIMCMILCMIAGSALAGSTKCVIIDVNDSILPEGQNKTITLECDTVENFDVGQKVKVKPTKVLKTIEGC